MDAYDLIRAVMRAERVQLTQKSADTHFVHKQTLALLKAKKKTQLKEKFMYITMHFMLTNKNLAECRLRSFIVYKSIIMMSHENAINRFTNLSLACRQSKMVDIYSAKRL